MSDKAAVLTAIIQYKLKNNGCTPTVRWLSYKCGISSTATVQRFINELVADGRLRRGEGKRDLKVIGSRWLYTNSERGEV
jgi:predicted transcriptional regulator